MAEQSKWLTDKYWLSPYNFDPEVRAQMTLPKKVRIHDVTLRESMQCPHVSLIPDEKYRIARELDKLGVYSIENGPYFSQREKEVTKELCNMHKRGEIKCKVTPLAHWQEEDIDLALECGADRVLISHLVNPWINKNTHHVSEEELIKRLTRVTAYAKKHKMYTTVQTFDTYKTPLDFLERLHKSLVYEAGADAIAIADTFGFALPWTVTWMVRKVKSWIPKTVIEHHGHNDFGMATAMMISAVVGGAEVVHTSINSTGERVGNPATEEVAMALNLLLGVETGIKLERLYPICELVSELTKVPIARNKPITGENEFLYGSGMIVWMIYQLAKTDRPAANMPFDPELIGKHGFEVIFGLGMGKALLTKELERMGLKATDEQKAEIVQRVKDEAYLRKWSVPRTAFEEIVKEVLGKK